MAATKQARLRKGSFSLREKSPLRACRRVRRRGCDEGFGPRVPGSHRIAHLAKRKGDAARRTSGPLTEPLPEGALHIKSKGSTSPAPAAAANEFARYEGHQVALRRLPTPPKRHRWWWGWEPAQAGLAPLVARGFNRCAEAALRSCWNSCAKPLRALRERNLAQPLLVQSRPHEIGRCGVSRHAVNTAAARVAALATCKGNIGKAIRRRQRHRAQPWMNTVASCHVGR